MQYTLRNVPNELDEALQKQVAAEQKSLNRVLIDALMRGLGLAPEPVVRRDLSDVAGKQTIDDETRAAFEEQRQLDPELWK